MKIVIHNKRVYEIEDYQYQSLIDYQTRLLSLPENQRKGSLEESMYNDCKFEVFGKSEFKKVANTF